MKIIFIGKNTSKPKSISFTSFVFIIFILFCLTFYLFNYFFEYKKNKVRIYIQENFCEKLWHSILEPNRIGSISSYVENIFTETPNKKFDVSVNIFSTYEEIWVFC